MIYNLSLELKLRVWTHFHIISIFAVENHLSVKIFYFYTSSRINRLHRFNLNISLVFTQIMLIIKYYSTNICLLYIYKFLKKYIILLGQNLKVSLGIIWRPTDNTGSYLMVKKNLTCYFLIMYSLLLSSKIAIWFHEIALTINVRLSS